MAFARRDNISAREGMLLGSLLAGMAFSNAGVGAVHALAYPLGGQFNIAHGVANALLLPYVLAANIVGAIDRLGVISKVMGITGPYRTKKTLAFSVVEYIRELAEDVGIPRSLQEVGIPEEALPEMARSASNVSRLLGNNPRQLTEDQILAIYRNAYDGKLGKRIDFMD